MLVSKVFHNKYLLSLISNFLDSSCKAHIYTKINLYYTYHLVCITKGNKWKTMSHIFYRSFK